jgi:hypothetical protein
MEDNSQRHHKEGSPMPDRACPICEREHARITAASTREAYHIECRQCGKLVIEGVFLKTLDKGQLSAAEQALLPHLSAYIREATENGLMPELGMDTWQHLARVHKRKLGA